MNMESLGIGRSNRVRPVVSISLEVKQMGRAKT